MIHNRTRGLIKRDSVLWFISTSFKGISQVLLIENAVTGFIFLVAIMISSLYMGFIALFSAFIGTLIGKIGGADEELVNKGLYGYNSVLTGTALSLYLSAEDRWIIALIGSAIAALFTAAMIHIMRQTDLPILTFPYIILTWFLILTTYRLNAFKISPKLVPQDLSHWALDIKGETNWLDGSVNGIGQIFFLDHTFSSILLIAAVFLAGWRLGLYVVVGNFFALLTSYGLGGERNLIFMGLYGYNAILTIIAVSVVYKGNLQHPLLLGILAACLTVPITASIVTWLLPYGLPALTMPFVFCSWLFLGAKKVLHKL